MPTSPAPSPRPLAVDARTAAAKASDTKTADTRSAAQTAAAAPSVTGVNPSSGPAGTAVVITGSGFTGTTQVRFGTALASFTVVSATQINATVPTGSGTVQITVTTPNGTSTQNVTFSYASATAPTLTSLNPASGPAGGGNSVVITGTGFTGTTQVLFGTTAATAFTVNSATQITATAPAGSGSVQVKVTTPGGSSNTLTYTYSTAPAISSLNPASGPQAGGNTVVITGTNLATTTSVHFGATAVGFTVLSNTQVSAVAPPGTVTVNVNVTTPGGTSNNLIYTYSAIPTVTTVNPGQGPTSGGNSVVITGTGFTGTTQVLFGTTPATVFTINSATQITATAPPGAPGASPVNVVTPGGTSSPGAFYFYVAPPALTSLSPASGPTAGGNTVVINGFHLTLTTAVHFGAASVPFTVLNDNQVSVTAPAGTATANVNLTTSGGTSNNLVYTYAPAPAVSGLNPALGPEIGGTIVTVTGTNLATTTSVHFGAASAAFTVLSDTQLTAVAPPGTGTVSVNVTATGGTSNNLPFTYVPPPG
ncbi:beta strand repeat-containing protein [Streptomyces sp. ME19-01-6]|uniref:beta strand repeat-containing protein n=1 Tax=Streptomyces sp. ME19-01-6 TaxID=3028686 RepID=UPI0029B6A2A3|nr:IPT/TIG domain-containing protein [Streptomyces sp. ME19-01-6]MDX3224701.1 IPT/TIG domain-containing protein [Streptomyces sp. ME19-01-6]